jgi:hypothetical protein
LSIGTKLSAYWPQAANSNVSGGNSGGLTLNIVNQSSAPVSGKAEETTDSQGRRSYKLILADAVGDAMEAKGGKANKVLRNNYGLRQRSVLR